MFESIALIGGFWFFLYVVAFLVGGVIVSEFDDFFSAIVTLVVMILAGEFLFGVPFLATIALNPLMVFVFIIGYIIFGAANAILWKYPTYLHDNKEHIKDDYENYLEAQKLVDNEESKDSFINSDYYSRYRPGSNLNAIFSWVLMWPWTLLWDVAHRPFTWIYNSFYNWIGQSLEAVGKRVTKGFLR